MAKGRNGRKSRRTRSCIHLNEARAALKAGNDQLYLYHLGRVAKRRPASTHHVLRGARTPWVRRDLADLINSAVRAA